ncbi:unnamed protein product [[Actinomadura] parvosata subsp. kistnae]|uniref:Uncharacterized protein n=1 Tax=[Actinomadura] parvosata subsp. kistnae TaxID=1909395 RepID=A0A1U9ZZE6_9ACTN|nr:hypothetical protein [Nonomuraea sp. ATCC 55076]AQZ63299.1 hypothetical protein BKM31_19150 [Nonomuraea sp. ATCC 55076]SPL98988.1 unnamed protein product [Actinomadura parvosata subsp. kistnae]
MRPTPPTPPADIARETGYNHETIRLRRWIEEFVGTLRSRRDLAAGIADFGGAAGDAMARIYDDHAQTLSDLLENRAGDLVDQLATTLAQREDRAACSPAVSARCYRVYLSGIATLLLAGEIRLRLRGARRRPALASGRHHLRQPPRPGDPRTPARREPMDTQPR